MAAIPYTKLFHIVTAPAASALAGETGTLTGDGVANVFSPSVRLSLDACTRCGRCGRCDQVCPSTQAGEPFAPRDLVLRTRRHLAAAEGDGDLAGASWAQDTIRLALDATIRRGLP